MSKAKEKIEEIRKLLFGENPAPAPNPDAKFLDAELKDGTKIQIEGEVIEIGKKVKVIPADGSEPMEAPNGTFELADGSKIVVEGGLITEVIPAAPADAPVENSEDEFKKQTAKSISDLQTEFKELKETLNAVRKEKRELESKMAEDKKSEVEFKKELFSLIEKVLEVPVAKPTQAPSKFSTVKPDRFQEVLNTIKTLKNN
jgi:hypothetical protein